MSSFKFIAVETNNLELENMDFDKLLDDCTNAENSITLLIKSNASKNIELNNIRAKLIETTQADLDQLVERELEFRTTLEDLRAKKNNLETNIKQYAGVNEKLNDLVSTIQRINNGKTNSDNQQKDLIMQISGTIQDFEAYKLDCSKLSQEFNSLCESLEKDAMEVEKSVEIASELVASLHKNDSIIRILDQQNKYAEQQFDLILNQLPWEPLTKQCIEDLRLSNNKSIRDIADSLEIQSNEIEELNESLNSKKRRKIELLEQLAGKLNSFVARRGEVISITNHSNDDQIYTNNID